MKSLVALACLLATTSIAAAQPAMTAPTPPPAPEAQGYVAAGAAFGVARGLYLAGTLEVGRRIHDSSWWFHTELLGGMEGGVDEPTYSSSGIQEVRAGLEARGCALQGVACIFLGADLAVARENYMAEYDSANDTSILPIGRLGLELGTTHVRLRPAIELGYKTFALTGALGVQW